MHKVNTAIFGIAAMTAALLAGPASAASDPLKAFPAAQEGYERVVINLPQVKDTERFRVQLIPGQTIEADCNTRSLSGEIKRETAQGWGYDYWVVSKVGPGPTTMMACPNDSKVEKFVAVYSDELIRYNPKLPVVVYVPKGVELRYKIWTAPEKATVAKAQ